MVHWLITRTLKDSSMPLNCYVNERKKKGGVKRERQQSDPNIIGFFTVVYSKRSPRQKISFGGVYNYKYF